MTVLSTQTSTGSQAPPQARPLCVRQPLVLAAALFLFGATVERWAQLGTTATVGPALLLLGTWAVLEWQALAADRVRMICLGAAMVFAAAGLWAVNQEAVAQREIARFLPPDNRETAVTLRMRVVVAPEAADSQKGYGVQSWVGRVYEVLTDRGWAAATGDVIVRSGGRTAWQTGDAVEICGWMALPEAARNPGAMDRRAMLAADRIFAQVRAREGGVQLLQRGAGGSTWLDTTRLYLRGKLLDRVALQDVPSGYTLTALLLGYRGAAITAPGGVSQAFSDAGVAHLLAISGAHLALMAGALWGVLRFVPLRPRRREILMVLVLGAYALATPCGPPIVRAAVVMVLVLLSRLWARPLQQLNMLAGAAMVVVLIRPADMLDAGFQLSFVTTAALIVFAPRMYHAWLDRWVARERVVVDLGRSRWLRWRLRMVQTAGALVVANIIGWLTAAPLVAMTFGQVNLWSVAAGLVAMPVVAVGMVFGALQMLAEVCSSALGGALLPATVAVGRGMIGVVETLAKLPGASVAVRPPSGFIVILIYVGVIGWALRRRIGLSRAGAINVMVGTMVVTAGWYAWTGAARQKAVEISVMDAGTSSAMLLRMPGGELWAINAGASQGGDASTMFLPAMRLEGTRRLAGMLVGNLDVAHASGAGELSEIFRPEVLVVPSDTWSRRGETLAGASLQRAAADASTNVHTVQAGQVMQMGEGVSVKILAGSDGTAGGLVIMLIYRQTRVLIADPRDEEALAQVLLGMNVRCDAVIWTGPQRGAADAKARAIAQGVGAKQVVWSGRGPWADRAPRAGEWNTAEGFVRVSMGDDVRVQH